MKLTKENLLRVIKEEITKMLEMEDKDEEKVAGKTEDEQDYSEDPHEMHENKELKEIESSEEERVAGRTRDQVHSEDEHQLLESTPEGYENIVKGIKKSEKKGDTPKTYVDKKSGERKDTNPWAIAHSMKNKGITPKK